VAFGSLFNHIEIRRRDSAEADIQKLVVPIDYGPKERWLTRLIQDPDLTKSVAQVVPRISYEKISLSYDSGRATKMLDRMNFDSADVRKRARVYTGVPYNINFQLSILVKYQSDGFQIVEQILPYFRPDLTIAMKPIPALGFLDQIPVILTSVNQTDSYEGDFEKRRVIVWTLDFTMRVYIYGPVRQGGRIQEVVIDLYDSTDLVLGDEMFIALEDEINSDVLLESQPDTIGNHLSNSIESLGTIPLDTLTIEGRVVDESTSNTYLTTGRVARIDVKALGESGSETLVTEYDGDVKRDLRGLDETD